MNSMFDHGQYIVAIVIISVWIPDIMEKIFENAIQSDLVWNADIVFQSKSFVSTYGVAFRQNNTIDRRLKYVGINAGNMDVTVLYSTDGLNKRFGLVTLEDDLHFFPEYNGVYLLRADRYEDFPELEEHNMR